MSSSNICQVSSCNKSQFTYCPHCSLHICIQCLNEHYFLMENDYKKILIDFKKELNARTNYNIEKQKKIFKNLYNNESIQYYQLEKFLSDKIDQNDKPTIKSIQTHEYVELKENFHSFMRNRAQFDQLLDQINHLISDFQENNRIIPSLPDLILPEQYAVATRSDEQPTSSIVIELDDDDDDDDDILDDDTDDDTDGSNESNFESNSIINLKSFVEKHISDMNTTIVPKTQSDEENEQICQYQILSRSSSVSPTRPSSSSVDPLFKYSPKQLRRLYLLCPFTRHTLGLQTHHCQTNGITNIPCMRPPSKKLSLFTHLHKHHSFNSPSSLRIIRALVHCSGQIDQINLFSHESLDALSMNVVIGYSNICPLTKYGVYGILPTHLVHLCPENNSNVVNLHHHLQAHHHLTHQFTRRIVRAMMHRIDRNIALIKPDDYIVCF